MKTKATQSQGASGKIRVKLDNRTIITLNSEASLDFWKTKYPDLKVLAAAS
jgi:hypothetical protein